MYDPLGVIEINSTKQIVIGSTTDDPPLNELIQKYYSWDADENSWTYTVAALSQLLGIDNIRYPFHICSTYARCIGEKGPAKEKYPRLVPEII